MATNEWLKKPIVLLSGGRTTTPLAQPLSEICQIAIFDVNAAQDLRNRIDNVVCPELGAGQHMRAMALNDAALVVSRIAGDKNAVDALRRNGTDPLAWVPGIVTGTLSQVAFDLRVLEAFCGEADVRAIVTHEDTTPRFRAMAMFGNSRGIPTVHIPHANLFCNVRPDIHDDCRCDYILAGSPWMKKWYADRGYPEERITITGVPNWDRWGDVNRTIDKAHARKVLAIDQDAPVVLYCTSWPQTTNIVDDHSVKARADMAVLQAAKRNGWTLIWSMHPGDRPEWQTNYARLALQHEVPALIVRGHLHYTARAADVAVSLGPSNVLVEAALAGTAPVEIPLRGYDYPATPPWRANPTEVSVTNVVNELLENPQRWQAKRDGFIAEFARSDDCGATERAVRKICEIAGIEVDA